MRACRAALHLLVERGGGAIVNVSSANARQPASMNVDYCASKAALTNLTKALSEEFAPQGVRVNTVSPGPVVTPWWTDEGGAAERFGELVGASAQAVLERVGPELMALSHRILVLRGGRAAGEVAAGEATEESLLRMILGDGG